MKKILAILVLPLIMFSCKKKENTVSQLVTYSTPTIAINGSEYYSINVGGSLPAIEATAYDSFYQERYPVVIDQSSLDNTKPGLNVIYLTSRNKNGMVGSKAVYIAVTNIDNSFDLSGTYKRSSNSQLVTVDKLARGLYRTNNVGGVLDIPDNASFIIPAYFVQTDTFSVEMPVQQTPLGELYGDNFNISYTPDVTLQYIVRNTSFGSAPRTFVRQ